MTGVGLGFVATQGSKYQGATVLAVGAADAMCLVVAIVVLLITVRPVHLDTVTAEGWSRWAALKPETLHEHMRADLRAERVSFLSRTVMIKFCPLRRGRRAVPDSCQVMRGTTGNGGEHLPTGPAPLAAPPMVSPGLARQRPELPKLMAPAGQVRIVFYVPLARSARCAAGRHGRPTRAHRCSKSGGSQPRESRRGWAGNAVIAARAKASEAHGV